MSPTEQLDQELREFMRGVRAQPVLTDQDEAVDAWGANCGPMSLAAVLGLSRVDAVQAMVQPFRGFMSPTDMLQALGRAQRIGSVTSYRKAEIANDGPWPALGFVRIQWLGPWCGPGVNPRAAYRYTHFVGARIIRPQEGPVRHDAQVEIYDATPNAWIPLERWATWCPTLWPKRATGWMPVTRIDVSLGAGPVAP